MRKLRVFYDDLHWKYAGWWTKLLLFVLALLKFVPEMILFGLVSALVSLSSTTYSIAGSMKARFRNIVDTGGYPVFSMWFHGPLMLASAALSLISVLLVALFTLFLSANQCDVVSRILLKSNLSGVANRIANRGLEKSKGGHTRAFLILTYIRSGSKRNLLIEKCVLDAWRIAHALVKDGSLHEQKQAGRIFNQLAEVYEWLGYSDAHVQAKKCRHEARKINMSLGLGDQLLKHP